MSEELRLLLWSEDFMLLIMMLGVIVGFPVIVWLEGFMPPKWRHLTAERDVRLPENSRRQG